MSTSFQDHFDGLVIRCAKFLPGTYFWNLRAAGIDRKWGRGNEDFSTIEHMITTVHPQSILDIGCGTGRLFPLYIKLKIPKVVGQEVSSWALHQAGIRYPSINISLTPTSIPHLSYPDQAFDLCISNRVLSAVHPRHLERTLKNIVRMSRHLYLNEFSASDQSQPSSYWFLHDYFVLLKTLCDFTVLETGRIDKQTYHFVRIDSRHFTA